MNLVEILLTVFLIAAVIAAAAAIIVRKKRGKGCSCGCERITGRLNSHYEF